jgi:hypothetical protein
MTNVANIMRLIRTRLNAIALGSYAKHAGQAVLREALSLSVDQPGDMDPHGIYVLEPVRTRTLDRQSRGGARVAEFALHLSSRLDPMIGEGAEDLTQAWDMAERIGHVLETDLGGVANIDVTSIAAQGSSPDGATYAHLITFTATYEGG